MAAVPPSSGVSVPPPSGATVPPTSGAAAVPPTVTAPQVTYAKPFPDISRIEVFNGENFKRWQERIFTVLDMHGVAYALTSLKPAADDPEYESWAYANKVCRHTVISILSNDLFDVCCLPS